MNWLNVIRRQIQKQKMQAGLASNKPTVADQVLSNEQNQGLGAINPNQPPAPQQQVAQAQPQQAPVEGVLDVDDVHLHLERNEVRGHQHQLVQLLQLEHQRLRDDGHPRTHRSRERNMVVVRCVGTDTDQQLLTRPHRGMTT